MNPNHLAAQLRTLVLKIALGLGGLVLVRELYVLLVSDGLPFEPLTLKGDFPSIASAVSLPWPLLEVAVLQGLHEFLVSRWLFVTIPLGGIFLVVLINLLYNRVIVPLLHLTSRAVFLAAGVFRKAPRQARHLVVCIDGTWNYPDHMEDGVIASSNVFKFFDNLEGDRRKLRELTVGAGRVKYHESDDGKVLQIGLYFPGVGNPVTYSALGGIMSGAFGLGAKSIRREAYRDIIRYYRTRADKITVVGFSRGAAIARLLATYVEHEGVPHLTLSDTLVGKFVVGILRTLLPRLKWIQKREVEVDFLGLWDTVAAFGISKNVLGIPFQRINLFSDMNVSAAVRHVVHMVAVDEQRDAFIPTLVEPPKPRVDGSEPETLIDEVWFPGVHANVGGGHADDGLARISLGYLCQRFVEHFETGSTPVFVKSGSFGELEKNIESRLQPSKSALYEMAPREMPEGAVLHESVIRKMARADLEYCPPNVSELMDRLDTKCDRAVANLTTLRDEGLISDDDLERARDTLMAKSRLRVRT